ncbi:MAG: hypothetical protein JKX76_00115 [Colwellia sp.]|nr:hypothetical protein [Colwellia sp.]
MDMIAEANRIKERLRNCETVDQVEMVATDERQIVMGWKNQAGDRGLMSIQITNLKAHMIKQLT